MEQAREMNSKRKSDNDENNQTNKKSKNDKDEDFFDFQNFNFNIFWRVISKQNEDILRKLFMVEEDDELPINHNYIIHFRSRELSVDDLSEKDILEYQQFMVKFLKFIENLTFRITGIINIPKQIKFIKNCKTLDIHEPLLAELPEELGQLTRLTYLTITNSKISMLPS